MCFLSGTSTSMHTPFALPTQVIVGSDMSHGRNVNFTDVCFMSDAYIDAALRRGGMAGGAVFLAHDRQWPERATEIIKR